MRKFAPSACLAEGRQHLNAETFFCLHELDVFAVAKCAVHSRSSHASYWYDRSAVDGSIEEKRSEPIHVGHTLQVFDAFTYCRQRKPGLQATHHRPICCSVKHSTTVLHHQAARP